MNNRSIGFRLASWYFLVFVAGILIFAALAWFAMRESLYGAIDAGLRDRADSLSDFLADIQTLGSDRMQEELQEHALPGQGGNLFQVRGEDGHWLFRSSPWLQRTFPSQSRPDWQGRNFKTIRLKSTASGFTPPRFKSSIRLIQSQSPRASIKQPRL